ncbi:hypothetical protein Q2T40_08515 [Winogradskyella maritima]|uniref:DUF2812 domain-containing protein n=1 Tax=Winogradskyella maritima TaxID=1517766 RepID=A0ABV8AJ36_9FLAO|nr:hypothetical protein [Winogradskyella maritima]
MHKYWKIKGSKSNKLIVIRNKTIYKGNPKYDELNKLNVESTDLSFLDNLFSVPYTYIKRIENQSGKNELKIYYGNNSEDELIVKDNKIKQEIFDVLKADLTSFNYVSKLPSIFNYGKKQFFALLFMTGLFIWSLYLAVQIENGANYEIIGSGRSIFGIVLFIASFGIIKIVIGFVLILSIISISLIRRLRSRSEMEILKR